MEIMDIPLTSEQRIRRKLAPERLEEMKGKIVTPADVDVLLRPMDPELPRAVSLLKPDGSPLLVYLPTALRGSALEGSYDTLHELRKFETDNRGLASGTERRKSFAEATRTRSKPVPSAIVGSFDPGGAYRYCRLTAWTGKEWDKYAGLFPLFTQIGMYLQRYVPDRWENQMREVMRTHPDWRIGDTPFTTITVNNTYPTGVHTDKGDLDEGFSTLSVIRRGTFTGGWLVFPEYRVGVDMHHGDLLLMDAHEWHGNTELTLQNPECDWCTEPADWWFTALRPDTKKSVRKPACNEHFNTIQAQATVSVQEREPVVPAERISIVSYMRTKMTTCGSAEEEAAKAAQQAEKRTAVDEMAAEAVG